MLEGGGKVPTKLINPKKRKTVFKFSSNSLNILSVYLKSSPSVT